MTATTTKFSTPESSPETIKSYENRQRNGRRLAYAFLILSISPIVLGYAWLIIASFSFRTRGLIPVNAEDNFGGLTLSNWDFLADGAIWTAMLNSLLIAVAMVIGVGIVSTSAGYALARMKFVGRKAFLSMTLVLHAFKAEMLLISIFFVLLTIGDWPVIGNIVGFNTVGGVALVMIALELPLGIWLMKGFFDGLAWDMERAAMIDGASRFRVWWEIMLPQIRPGIAALSLFTFIAGWNAYLVPFTFTIGTKVANMPVFLNQLVSDTAPVNWNQIAAVGMFQLIPLLIFFIFTQELLLNIYAGGSKGGN
jgi:inositol-phosphate transport system permease protein